MQTPPVKSRFIAAMDSLQAEASRGPLTLRRIFQLLGEEGHAVLMIFLCLPFMQPIPFPGLSTPLGLLIAVVGSFLYFDRPPWLPQRFEELKISSEVILKTSEVAEKIWTYAAKIVKTRWSFLVDNFLFRTLSLVVIVGNGILLALPLPIPFSNTIPVVGIILSAIGYMEKDGLFIILSYLWCFVVVSFFATLTVGAVDLYHFLW